MIERIKVLLALIMLFITITINIEIMKIILDKYIRERCYNMPINQYVEDKTCEKYTWEEYMEEHYNE